MLYMQHVFSKISVKNVFIVIKIWKPVQLLPLDPAGVLPSHRPCNYLQLFSFPGSCDMV